MILPESNDIEELLRIAKGFPHGDVKSRFPYYLKAAQLGDAEAQYMCGLKYYADISTARDYAKALFWFEKAAEQGDASAQYQCGHIYRKGEGTAVDMGKALSWYEKAHHWFKRAADAGHKEAAEKLKEYL